MITSRAGGVKNTPIVCSPVLRLERESRLQLKHGGAAAAEWFDANRGLALGAPRDEAPAEQVEMLLRFVQWYFKDGRYEVGLDAGKKAVEVARHFALLALLRRSLNLLGLIYSRLGATAQSTICYVEGMQLADQIGDRVGKAAVIANLAELKFNSGLIGESIILNQYVIELSANEPQFVQLLADAHHNIAVASVLLEDFASAAREMQESDRYAIQPSNHFLAHQQVIAEATRSRILVELGRLREARDSAVRAERIALQINSRPSLVQASLALALCHAAAGDGNAALDLVCTLRDQVSQDEPLYRDLLEIEALCNLYAGKSETAALVREKFLSHLAQYQRRCVIRQIAAFQRSLRTLGGAAEAELLELPLTARDLLAHSWKLPQRADLLRGQLDALASLADQREDEAEHCLRVGRLVKRLAMKTGYSETGADAVGRAARLHDIGKLATPDILLLKRGRLSVMERGIVQRHTIEGAQILTDISATVENSRGYEKLVDSLRLASEIALHHHEWWNGSGYPRQLRTIAISEGARMTALADGFDELITARPYKNPLSVDEAIARICERSGTQFDPQLCTAFTSLVRELQECYGRQLENFAPRDTELSSFEAANRIVQRVIGSCRPGSAVGVKPQRSEDLDGNCVRV